MSEGLTKKELDWVVKKLVEKIEERRPEHGAHTSELIERECKTYMDALQIVLKA